MKQPSSAPAHKPLPEAASILLTDRVVLRVAGGQADHFLHGQFSQSLTEVTSRHSPRAAANTPKGRAYCLTRLVRDGNDVLMDIPGTLAEPVQNQLRKYMMLFRGTTMTVDAGARIFGLLGDAVAEALVPGAAQALATPGDSLMTGTHHLIRTESTGDGLPRFEFWQCGPLEELLQQTLDRFTNASPAAWLASEIAAGVASLTPDTQESYVPQMLNWQHLGGIHFKKGCYTGQEVIARMHFLGQLKKSLYRLGTDRAETIPAAGTIVLADGKSCGEVISAVGYDDGSAEALAVLRHDSAANELRFERIDTAEIRQLPLPYAVPEREKDQ